MTVNEIIHNLSTMKLTASVWTKPTIIAAMSALRQLSFENEELRTRLEEMKECTTEKKAL